jgi:uncharacterized membrane-anchored protein YitT (DUF2179 family)
MNIHLPPLRFFIGSILLAAAVVFLENAAHISSGGAAGLSIALSHVLHISIGVSNLVIKCIIFSLVFWQGGAHLGVWTIVSTLISSLSMWLFEMIPLPFVWNPWVALLCILICSCFPMALLLSKGYSTGGFSSVAQVLWSKWRVPLWLSLLVLNATSVVSMYLSFGTMSGIFTLVASFLSGFSTDFWTKLLTKWLAEPQLAASNDSCSQ